MSKVALIAQKRVLLLDGAMGTLIQSQPLKASDFFLDDSLNSYGSYEVLNLTRGDLIFDIHYSYLRSGADIIETNTFGANRFSLKQYNLENYVYDLNLAGAEIAKAAAQEFFLATNKEVFVAGTIGPSSKSASFSPSVDNPSYRPYVFDDFVEAFEEQAEGLIDGNVDLILIETVFDTLVAKAAIVATLNVLKRKQKEIDIMVSATFSDKSGRTLSGQTLKAFVDSLSSYPLFSLGLNCSTGIKEMAPLIKELASYSPFRLSAHPNAGFPDEDGLYSQSAEQMSSFMKSLLDEGLLNIVGGCCGTNEKHIKALSEVAKSAPVRPLPPKRGTLRLSGLEPLKTKNDNFIIIGERTNVAGSRKFARLIKEKAYVEALAIAAQQVEDGANLIDICMDDPLIDSQQEMGIFLRLAQSDPNIAKVPFMIDSSQWSTLEVALKEIQGRGIVNSISLKEGEEIFIKRGKFIDKMGFAMVVMLFDEKGQADTFERKIEIAKRSYTLLVENNIAPNSIIFDPNVLSIATGIDEHDYYAIDFIRAAAWIKANLKGAFVSGGISNLSFSFRGNNSLREIIHAIFLHHSVKNGLDMAIVNPKTLLSIDNIDKETFTVVESVILANQKDVVASRQKLIELALKPVNMVSIEKKEERQNQWRLFDVEKRLSEAVLLGEEAFLKVDLEEALSIDAVKLIEGPLMDGMKKVGKLFGEGKLFLPQVVRSARVMKKGVDLLQGRLKESFATSKSEGTIVLATVKGDVHDIGKNIVALILECNSFKIIDLGVMTDSDTILEESLKHKADLVALSGLITPSLMEMAHICRLFAKNNLKIPIMVGGATTSLEHTALRLAPLYNDNVFHGKDATEAVFIAKNLLSQNKDDFITQTKNQIKTTREKERDKKKILPLSVAHNLAFIKQGSAPKAKKYGIHTIDTFDFEAVLKHFNYALLCRQWKVPFKSDEAKHLIAEVNNLLEDNHYRSIFSSSLKAVIGIFEAKTENQRDVVLYENGKRGATFSFLRSQSPSEDGLCRSLADYVNSEQNDTVGLFVVTAGQKVADLIEKIKKEKDDYNALLIQTIADNLSGALSSYLEEFIGESYWNFEKGDLIRPAIGYPSAPDHYQKRVLFDLLDVTNKIGVSLTENYVMVPTASVCGFYFVGKDLKYFSLGPLGENQLEKYRLLRGISKEELEFTLLSVKGDENESH